MCSSLRKSGFLHFLPGRVSRLISLEECWLGLARSTGTHDLKTLNLILTFTGKLFSGTTRRHHHQIARLYRYGNPRQLVAAASPDFSIIAHQIEGGKVPSHSSSGPRAGIHAGLLLSSPLFGAKSSTLHLPYPIKASVDQSTFLFIHFTYRGS